MTEIQQKVTQTFTSECGKILTICEGDTSLSVLHDYLLKLKGEMIDRMLQNQINEEKELEPKNKEQEE